MPIRSLCTDGGAATSSGAARAPGPRPISLRIRLIAFGAAGAVVISGAGVLILPWLDGSRLYPWRAAAIFLLIMGVAARFVHEHPFPRLGPANCVTGVRAMLVAMVSALLGESLLPGVAVAALVASGAIVLLDGIDGWLARRTQLASAFGARFDMEVDALLGLVLSILVWRHGKAGAWILLGGLFRYIFGAAGWLWAWMARPLASTRRAKAIAILNIMGLMVALTPTLQAPFSGWAAAAALAALTWSFTVDVNRLWRQAR